MCCCSLAWCSPPWAALLLGGAGFLCLRKLLGAHTMPRQCFSFAVALAIPGIALGVDGERKQFVRVMSSISPGMVRSEVDARVQGYRVRAGSDSRALAGLGSWGLTAEQFTAEGLAAVRWCETHPEFSSDVLLVAYDTENAVQRIELRLD
ncbi:MAG: hypothetical protein ACI9EF_001629 [Pseudohongiellaceae bacterium]|jgi:hypothetical protein